MTGHPVPPALAGIVDELCDSAWPEVVATWSRLTPTGFPVELSVTSDPRTVRWTAEVAPPEVPEAARLARVARHLERQAQPAEPMLLGALQTMQAGRELRFGAWLGGRTATDGTSRFKLYAEIPAGVPAVRLPLPDAVLDVLPSLPAGSRPRMIGVEPSRRRIELYLRLPDVAPEALDAMFAAARVHGAVQSIDGALLDGRARLVGRRLGLTLAASAGSSTVEVTIVVSARTLFPGSRELVDALVPGLASVPSAFPRTLVSMAVLPDGAGIAFGVGLTTRVASVAEFHGSASADRKPVAPIAV